MKTTKIDATTTGTSIDTGPTTSQYKTSTTGTATTYGPDKFIHTCKTWLEVDANNIIVNARAEGNRCWQE